MDTHVNQEKLNIKQQRFNSNIFYDYLKSGVIVFSSHKTLKYLQLPKSSFVPTIPIHMMKSKALRFIHQKHYF